MANEAMIPPCAQCPWRVENQGKPTPGGFFTKRNLRRLWGQIRRGGGVQSCHVTDTSHPDHVAAGAKDIPSGVRECGGSLVLVQRELRILQALSGGGEASDEGVEEYLARGDLGLTKEGLLYHAVARAMPLPLGTGEPMICVDEELLDAEWIDRPHNERAVADSRTVRELQAAG